MTERTKHGFWSGIALGGLSGVLLVAAAFTLLPRVSAAGRLPIGFLHGHWAREVDRDHVEFATDYVLRRLNATDAQRERIRATVGDSIDGLGDLAERHRQNREALFDALSKTTVDRGALEEFRKAELELADEASRRLLTTVAEVAETLTLEQRNELLAHIRSLDH